MSHLDTIAAHPMPFAALLGITFVEAEPARVRAHLTIREDLCTVGHAAHGGVLMAFADTVGAAATILNLPEGAKGTTTLESKTNFIAGVPDGTVLSATAMPIHRGRRTQVWQTRIETAEGRLVAVVTQTQMVL